MANGHLLAAPDRIVDDLVCFLEPHGITCEIHNETHHDHGRYIVDLTEINCSTEKTRVELAIEKRRGRNGVDMLIAPDRKSIFRRDLESEALAQEIVDILCGQGATDDPDARCDKLK